MWLVVDTTVTNMRVSACVWILIILYTCTCKRYAVRRSLLCSAAGRMRFTVQSPPSPVNNDDVSRSSSAHTTVDTADSLPFCSGSLGMCRIRVEPLPSTNEQRNLLTTSPNVDEERGTSCVIDHGRVDNDDDVHLSEQVLSLSLHEIISELWWLSEWQSEDRCNCSVTVTKALVLRPC